MSDRSKTYPPPPWHVIWGRYRSDCYNCGAYWGPILRKPSSILMRLRIRYFGPRTKVHPDGTQSCLPKGTEQWYEKVNTGDGSVNLLGP